MTAPFDPERALRALRDADVRFVVIGGLAGTIRGWAVVTQDLDVCPAGDEENLERLAGVLRGLGARLRGVDEEVPFILDARSLGAGDAFTFATDAGDLDVIVTPSGTRGFADLDAGATEEVVGERLAVRVVSLDDLIRMKRASGRTKDRLHLEHLAALREEAEGDA